MTLHRRGFIAGLIACPICAGLARADDSAPHWTYEGHGDPAEWGKLDKMGRLAGAQKKRRFRPYSGATRYVLVSGWRQP